MSEINFKPLLPVILPADYKNNYTTELQHDEYIAMTDSVSSGALRAFLKSAAHFIDYLMIKEEDDEAGESKSLKFGTLAHLMVLEPKRFRECFLLQPDFGDQRSSTNREKKNKWLYDLPKNKIPINEKDLVRLTAIAENISKHPSARAMLEKGISEVSVFVRCPKTGLKLRIRVDWLVESLLDFIDFKTTTDAREEPFAKSIDKFGYDVQMSFYEYVLLLMFEKEIPPTLLAAESKRPHSIAVYPVGMLTRDIGLQLVMQGLNGIKKCIDEDRWPSIQDEARVIEVPDYKLRKWGML